MGFWRSLVRAVMSDYGLLGKAIADKIDREGASFDEHTTFERQAPPLTAVPSMPRAFAPAPTHEPIREVTFQVLANNSYWRTVGSGITAGSAVVDGLNRLKSEFPDVPVRAIDKVTQTLIDIRT